MKPYIYLLLFTIFFSCQTEESVEFTDVPIIKSYLHPSSPILVQIERQTPYESDASYSNDNLNELELILEYDTVVEKLISLGNGQYSIPSMKIEQGYSYSLSFKYNSKNVQAYTTVPSEPKNFSVSETFMYIERIDSNSFGNGPPGFNDIDPIEIAWDNPDNSYYLLIIENIETNLDPIRDFGDLEVPEISFRKSPTMENEEVINAMEFQYFGTHRVILYHVHPDYAALYDEVNSSSQNLENPSTSITNGYGIFTGINSDTINIEILEEY